MSKVFTKINEKDLSQGIFVSSFEETNKDALYLRRKGKRVFLSFSWDFLYWKDLERTEEVNRRVTETAILVRENGGWKWEKEFDNPSILLWAQYLASFPMPVDGFDNRITPVKNFRLFKKNWKRIVSLPVPMQETL